MTHPTPQELYDAYKTGKDVFRLSEKGIWYDIRTLHCPMSQIYEWFITKPEQFTLTDPNAKEEPEGSVMQFARQILHGDEAHQEWLLKEAKDFICATEEPSAPTLGELSELQACLERHNLTVEQVIEMIDSTFNNLGFLPDAPTPKPTPHEGQRLTMELFMDDEFMSKVKQVEWFDKVANRQNEDHQDPAYQFAYAKIHNALQRNWKVTITEVKPVIPKSK